MKLSYDKKAKGLTAEVREYLTSSQSCKSQYIYIYILRINKSHYLNVRYNELLLPTYMKILTSGTLLSTWFCWKTNVKQSIKQWVWNTADTS